MVGAVLRAVARPGLAHEAAHARPVRQRERPDRQGRRHLGDEAPNSASPSSHTSTAIAAPPSGARARPGLGGTAPGDASGCGKSTLLNVIGGLEPADGGRVEVDGEPVAGPGADRGLVVQGHSPYPWRIVAENVAFGLETAGMPWAERRARVAEPLDVMGLSGRADRLPGSCPGRVAAEVPVPLAADRGPSVRRDECSWTCATASRRSWSTRSAPEAAARPRGRAGPRGPHVGACQGGTGPRANRSSVSRTHEEATT